MIGVDDKQDLGDFARKSCDLYDLAFPETKPEDGDGDDPMIGVGVGDLERVKRPLDDHERFGLFVRENRHIQCVFGGFGQVIGGDVGADRATGKPDNSPPDPQGHQHPPPVPTDITRPQIILPSDELRCFKPALAQVIKRSR